MHVITGWLERTHQRERSMSVALEVQQQIYLKSKQLPVSKRLKMSVLSSVKSLPLCLYTSKRKKKKNFKRKYRKSDPSGIFLGA